MASLIRLAQKCFTCTLILSTKHSQEYQIFFTTFGMGTPYLLVYIYIPSPNQQKTIRPTDEVIMMKSWWNDGETYETYDIISVNTASKCLVRMKGSWDLEFEPSVEEIMDYRWYNMVILSVSFLWRARALGGISLFSLACTRQVEVMSGSIGSSRAPTEHAQFVGVSEVDNGGI